MCTLPLTCLLSSIRSSNTTVVVVSSGEDDPIVSSGSSFVRSVLSVILLPQLLSRCYIFHVCCREEYSVTHAPAFTCDSATALFVWSISEGKLRTHWCCVIVYLRLLVVSFSREEPKRNETGIMSTVRIHTDAPLNSPQNLLLSFWIERVGAQGSRREREREREEQVRTNRMTYCCSISDRDIDSLGL